MTATESLQSKANEMLGQLDQGRLTAVVHLLEAMLEEDDEPVTEQDIRDVEEGREWFAARGGRGIPMEEVLADFGLTLDDFPLKD